MAEAAIGKPRVIVLIHGVGATTPGAMLRQCAGEMAGPMEMHQLAGAVYPKVRLDGDKDFSAAYEVYWADTKPGGDSLVARALRVFHVLLGLSRLGGSGWVAEPVGINQPSIFGKALHIMLWGFVAALPCVYLPLLHVAVLPGSWKLVGAMLSVTPTLILAAYLGRYDRWCRLAGFLGLVAAASTTTLALSEMITLRQGAQFSGLLMSWTFVAVIAATFLACVELGIKAARARCKPPNAALLVRFATLSLPFTIVGGVLGSMTWALNLFALMTAVGVGPHYPSQGQRLLEEWGQTYTDALFYDLALLELVFALTTLAFLLFVALVFAAFVIRLHAAAGRTPPIGARARNGLLASLVVLAAGGIIIATLFVFNAAFLPGEKIQSLWPFGAIHTGFVGLAEDALGTAGAGIFAIYAASAARVLGFLPWLLGPVRQGSALAADVILYLVSDDRLSYGRHARDRLSNLLRKLQEDTDVYLLAHSQGTKIALDALNEHSDIHPSLITAGSPIDTLYGRFLAVACSRPVQLGSWHNFYRPSDYIGGGVEAALANIRLESDFRENHLNYFHDPAILEVLRNEVKHPTPRD